jgi:hypothetical protein
LAALHSNYLKIGPEFDDDETLPNFTKRKHPRKGEKKKQRSKHQSPGKQNSPKEVGHKEERAPLRTKPSTRNM